jgi:hypothetical protein
MTKIQLTFASKIEAFQVEASVPTFCSIHSLSFLKKIYAAKFLNFHQDLNEIFSLYLPC